MSELLADEEFFRLKEAFFGKGSCSCVEIDDTDLCLSVAKAQRDKSDAENQKKLEEILKGKLAIHIAHKDNLVDVGEWAECQDIGVFVYFPGDTYWQVLKG